MHWWGLCCLTFAMSVGPKGAKRPLERALDEGAGLSFATVDGKWAIRLLIDQAPATQRMRR